MTKSHIKNTAASVRQRLLNKARETACPFRRRRGQELSSSTPNRKVTDQGGLRSRDTCIVNIPLENQPPQADAGRNHTGTPGALVSLDGSSSSDPEGAALSYRWTQLADPPVTLSDPKVAKPTFGCTNPYECK